ncbi:cytochrome P450 [Okeania sp. KiyG1]|uniref:cytochrome P450 n=1 Tax=Okeania sp. KiyG1 TaxID=2720165 RepID=UPI001921562B|nr:cytochrome P450 [Okeania sp. KiyG1]GFZ92535.1 cytochrome P450 [Okeania sp. KiyG1]
MMKLPDSPKNPHLLQKIQYFTDPISYLESNQEQYGDIFNAPILDNSKRQLLVSHPEGLKQLFTKDGQKFYAETVEFLRFIVGDESIFCLEGNSHKRARKLLMPLFHQEGISVYGQTICNRTEQVFSRLTPGTNFSAYRVAQEISTAIMSSIILGIYEEKRVQQLTQLMIEFWNSVSSPLIASVLYFPSLRKDLGAWSPWGYFRHLMEQIDQFLYTEIRDRRVQYDPARTNILDSLMSAEDEEGQRLNDQQLRDELISIIIGHPGVVSTISWALYWIHQHPEVGEKLLKELDTLDECPEAMTIFNLPYLTAVCQETLRIYPPAILTVPRVVKEPVELMGYELEPGTKVCACIYLTHHREYLYPESKKFQPERFLEKQYTPYEFLPFGGSSRRCIGDTLALFDIKLVLATILDNYQLALVNNQSVKPHLQGFGTLVPSSGVKMVFKGKR